MVVHKSFRLEGNSSIKLLILYAILILNGDWDHNQILHFSQVSIWLCGHIFVHPPHVLITWICIAVFPLSPDFWFSYVTRAT